MTTPKRGARGLRAAVAAWLAVAIGLAAADLSASEGPMSPPADASTAPRYLPMPGKAVGVLVSDVQDVLRHEGRYGPPDAVCFARGEASYRWFYVPARGGAQGESMTIPVGEAGEKVQVFDNLVMATPKALKPWGVNAPYALVEVEVNGGRGSPAEESFAATDLKVLDGSAQYRIKVADAIKKVRDLYNGRFAKDSDGRKKLDEEMARVQKEALKDRKPTGSPKQTDRTYVTWLPDREVLRVEFRTELRDGLYQSGRGVERIRRTTLARKSRRPRRSRRVTPASSTVRRSASSSAWSTRYPRTARFGEGRPLTAHPFIKDLPPPGSAPSGGAPPGAIPRRAEGILIRIPGSSAWSLGSRRIVPIP